MTQDKIRKRSSRLKSTKTSASAQQKFLHELARRSRPTKEEIIKRLQRMPKKRWVSPSRAHTGLSYVLSTEIDFHQKNKLAALIGFSDLLDFSKLSTQLSVIQAQNYRRIESLNAGLYGQNFVYINNPVGDLLYMDLKNKAYLHLGSDQIPQIKMERDLGIDIDEDFLFEEGELIQGRQTKKVIITIISPRRLRWVLWVTPDKELQPFFKDVTNTIFGVAKNCKVMARVFQKISKVGFPLKGEVFMVTSGGTFATSPAVRFALKEVTIREVDPSEFAIPDEYKDMRIPKEVKARSKPKPIKVLKPIRLSKIRPGKRGRRLRSGAKRSSTRRLQTFTRGVLPSWEDWMGESEIEIPECMGDTYNSQVSLRVEQALLDDLKFFLNSISMRLQSFEGRNGTIKINWLAQFQLYSESLSGGDALYCLLRDAPVPGDPDPEEATGGKGLLDRLAETQAQAAMIEGTILSDLSLSDTTLISRISSILTNPAILEEDRWAALGPSYQVAVREAWLNQRIATLEFEYSDSLEPQTVFHDLLVVKPANIHFSFTIDRVPIVDKLIVGDGKVDLSLNIPGIFVNTEILRWPSGLYSFIVGVGAAIACMLVPLVCALTLAVAAVAVFLALDIASVTAWLSNITIDATIEFVENLDHVLVPNVTVADIDATVDTLYVSYAPEVVHQIVGAILNLAVDWSDTLLNELKDQLEEKLKEKLTEFSLLTFPPLLLRTFPSTTYPASVSAVESFATGINSDHLYLQSKAVPNFGPTGGLFRLWSSLGMSPYTTQTGLIKRSVLEQLRRDFRSGVGEGARQYGGFAVSQNLLNHLLYVLWCRGDFNYVLSQSYAQYIVARLQEVCSECKFPEPYYVRVWPAVPPRLVLTPREFFRENREYATAFFDDVRLCVTVSDGQYEGGVGEFQFSAQTGAQIGFGRVDPDTGELDLTKVTGRYVDIFFDLERIGVLIINPEIQDAIGEGPRLSAIRVDMVDSLEDVFMLAMRSMLDPRNDKVIPRPSAAHYDVQSYTLAGQNVLVQLVPHRGILYGVFGLTGAILQIFPGGIIDVNDHTMTSCADAKTILEIV